MELISIIIPVYNCENYLERCIQTVMNQTYKNIEILLINDGSTDNSLQICERLKTTDERIRVFNKLNSGVSSTRKYGVNHATGDFIMFVDSDDWIDKDTCEYLMKLQKRINADVVCCDYYINNDFKYKNEKI